jgi:hypothetical protein
MNDDERVDLSPLDPTLDELRFERAIQAITAQAAPMLAARRSQSTRLGVIAAWRRPVWLIAAAVLLLAGVSLLRGSSTTASTAPQTYANTFPDALGVPRSMSGYLLSGTVPSVEQLITTEVRQ